MRFVYIILLSLLPLVSGAQFMHAGALNVRSPRMELNGEWGALPIMVLGSDDIMQFSFDEMSHTYHRYIYRITHCRANWEPSELFDIDFLNGFNEMPIEEWENSVNTTMLYTN